MGKIKVMKNRDKVDNFEDTRVKVKMSRVRAEFLAGRGQDTHAISKLIDKLIELERRIGALEEDKVAN